MKNNRYEYKTESELHFFEFISEGKNGKVRKIVEYTPTSVKDIYNLAFGDYDELMDEMSDVTITNNGDSQKVLSTVASTVYAFTGMYPHAWIYATGSSLARTRLYRMGIANNIEEISVDFHVFGLKNEKWNNFEKGIQYDAFLVTRKNRNFEL